MSKRTVKDVLIGTREILGGIRVPMAFKEDIADPIFYAIHNLTQCINTYNELEAQEKAKPEEVPENGGEPDSGNADTE